MLPKTIRQQKVSKQARYFIMYVRTILNLVLFCIIEREKPLDSAYRIL